jgi:uncharacterized protein (TIGR03437 family)
MCGTQVTVDGIPAGLLAVLERQINLKIPQEVPAAADAAVVVTVNGVSSQPVMVAFGKPKVILSVEGAAYVHMDCTQAAAPLQRCLSICTKSRELRRR